jgi:cell wall assembly regulator SMI1
MNFHRRMIAAMRRAPVWGSERRRDNIAVVCQGATVPEMRVWMSSIQGIEVPRSAKRAEVVAAVMAVAAGPEA